MNQIFKDILRQSPLTAATMAKTLNIKDYLHLYLGCDIYSVPQSSEYFIEKLTGVECDYIYINGEITDDFSQYKPILRPLSDMTEEERIEYTGIINMETRDFECLLQSAIEQFASGTKYLLSKRFDLFGLIEAGLAIDSTTINK